MGIACVLDTGLLQVTAFYLFTFWVGGEVKVLWQHPLNALDLEEPEGPAAPITPSTEPAAQD